MMLSSSKVICKRIIMDFKSLVNIFFGKKFIPNHAKGQGIAPARVAPLAGAGALVNPLKQKNNFSRFIRTEILYVEYYGIPA